MLGISFEQRMDRSLLVRSVIDGSPAAQKGIQAGDVIIALNGKGLEEYEFGDVARLLQEPNKEIELSLKRNDGLIRLRLTLRRLI